MKKNTVSFQNLHVTDYVPGLIAVVGCDGTGKSTLTQDLLTNLRQRRMTEKCYLGLISGEDGDKIKRLPLIGIWLERRLATKSEKTQSMRSKSPALWAALIMLGLSYWRARNLKKAISLAESGVLVISDRYPQAEISGFHYDGPGIGVERAKNRLIAWLAKKENKLYDKMARVRPELIIRLNIDVHTAFARKPDHNYIELIDKIDVMVQLTYNGAQIIDLDSRAPYTDVLKNSLNAINAISIQD